MHVYMPAHFAEVREPFLGSVLAFCLIEGILPCLCCPVYPWLTGLWASCLHFPSHHRNVGITSGLLHLALALCVEMPDLSSLLCSIFFFFCILFHISICLMFVAIFFIGMLAFIFSRTSKSVMTCPSFMPRFYWYLDFDLMIVLLKKCSFYFMIFRSFKHDRIICYLLN